MKGYSNDQLLKTIKVRTLRNCKKLRDTPNFDKNCENKNYENGAELRDEPKFDDVVQSQI